MDFGEAAPLLDAEELAPGDPFRVGAAAQAAPMDGLRADPHAVAEPRHRQLGPQPHVDDVAEGADLLGPIAGHAAADGEDADPLRRAVSAGRSRKGPGTD